jgi:NDP-sugar pyrophosphorylase family protein
MKAMILAAGFGTRFQPVTLTLPKPLIPVCNKPLIAWAVDSFLSQGIHDFIVNLHHLPEPIRDYLPRTYPQARFQFSFEQEILGTGGGIRRVRPMLAGEEEFFVGNGDTIQTVPVEALRHARGDAVAALTLRHAPEGDHFTPVFYQDGRVTGFGKGSGEALMFAGSHLISSRAFDLMPDKDVFGIVEELYQPLLQRGERIAAVIDDGPWHDIGTPRRYLAASRALCGGNVIGARSVVEGTLRDSVVWDDCRIGPGVTLERCIVAHGMDLEGPAEYRDKLITREEIRPIQ